MSCHCLDLLGLQVGKVGAATYGFLGMLTAVEDTERVALGQGTAGNSGTDNAENFYPVANPDVYGPRVGRKLSQH